MATDELLTIPEVAGQLKVGRATVYRLIAGGHLDRVDVGSKRGGRPKTRIKQSSVDRFVSARTTKGRKAA